MTSFLHPEGGQETWNILIINILLHVLQKETSLSCCLCLRLSLSWPAHTSVVPKQSGCQPLPFFHFLYAYSQRHEVIVLMQRAIAEPPVCTLSHSLTPLMGQVVFFLSQQRSWMVYNVSLFCFFVFFPLCDLSSEFEASTGNFFQDKVINTSSNSC